MLLRILFLLIISSSLSPCLGQKSSQLDSVYAVALALERTEERAQALHVLAWEALNISPEKSKFYAEEALRLTSSMDLKTLEAQSLNCLGAASLLLSDYESSKHYWERSYNLFSDLGDKQGITNVLGNLGYYYQQDGDYEKALETQYEALTLFEEIQDSNGICNTMLQIGNIYMETEDYTKALYYDSMAIQCFRNVEDGFGEAICYGNMANIYVEQNQLEQAEHLYTLAIAAFSELESPQNLARELGNLSTLYENRKQLKRALETSFEAVEIYEQNEFLHGSPVAIGNIGSYYLTAYQLRMAGDTTAQYPEGSNSYYLNQAEHYLKMAFDRSSADNEVVMTQWFSETLATVYDSLDKAELALNYFRISNNIQDSIVNEETQVQIERLTTEREIAIRDKQIELDRLAVQKKKNERIYFIIGILFLILILGLIYRNYYAQKVSNLKLELLNEEITKANHTLESSNLSLHRTLVELKQTQDQLIESERQKEKAQLRSRISQDIHDDISSGLTKINWLVESLKLTMVSDNLEKSNQLMQKIGTSARKTVAKLGEIVWSTSPERDNLSSLLRYMEEHIDDFLSNSHISYTVTFPSSNLNVEVDPEVRRNIFLVLKEALNNCFKYSGADKIDIEFERKGARFRFEVRDDGHGFTEGDIQGGGHGLSNMRKRMEDIGGNLDIESYLGQGTSIMASGSLAESSIYLL